MKNNPPKIMDKWQIGLLISYGILQLCQMYFYIQEILFISLNYEEVKAGNVSVPLSLSIPYTIFTLFSLSALVWIAVRFITFRKRKRDYLLEQNGK